MPKTAQLYESDEAMNEFPGGAWYQEYLQEVARVVTAPPLIAPAPLVWSKSPLPELHDCCPA